MKKAFITGASGFIGFEVAREFQRRGYEVAGLVRSDVSARQLLAAEIRPVIGTLQGVDGWINAARNSNVIVHAALDHGPDSMSLDREITRVMLQAGRDRKTTFVYTSGVWIQGSTGDRVANETTPLDPTPLVRDRIATEEMVRTAVGVRGMVMRPGVVYGGSGGLTAGWFRGDPVVDGRNRWAMVHVHDLARAYRLLAERGETGETVLVANDDATPTGVLARKARESAGLSGEPEFISLEDARRTMGDFADALALDQLVGSHRARERLGWKPVQPRFAEGVQRFFRAWHSAQRANT